MPDKFGDVETVGDLVKMDDETFEEYLEHKGWDADALVLIRSLRDTIVAAQGLLDSLSKMRRWLNA